MKKFLVGLALIAFLNTPKVNAQVSTTRILVGGMGGSSFGNLFIGPSVAIEVPLTKHVEVRAENDFAPVEQHIKLGSGWANDVSAGGIIWLTKSIGLNGGAEHSQYHVSIAKSGEYARGGLTVRKSYQGWPLRLTFDYVREFNNGIFPRTLSGTESARLQAGEFDLDMRVKCWGPACYRLKFGFMIGHVLTQSNPICDGTFGITGGNGPNGTCYRTGASSGSFTTSLLFEFPRRRATEADAF
jgi:hypothetical protein